MTLTDSSELHFIDDLPMKNKGEKNIFVSKQKKQKNKKQKRNLIRWL